MRDVLLVGCPAAFRLLLPRDARVADDSVTNPVVVVVGSEVDNPIFEAQRLARRHRGATFIVTAGHERLSEVQLQLQITPFVPLSTRVVLDEIETVREAVSRALKRATQTRLQRRVAKQASQRIARPAPQRTSNAGPLFFQLFDRHRSGLVREACEALPTSASDLVSELSSERERELGHAAANGDWDGYAEQLARHGRASFDLGVSETDWTRYYGRLRGAFIDLVADRNSGCIRDAESFFSRAQLRVLDGLAGVRADFERERRRAETVLHAFVEASPDAVVTMTLGGTITTWNRGAEARFGYRATDVVGCHISRIVPPVLHSELDEHLEAVGRGLLVAEHQTRRVHQNGKVIDVALSLSPIDDGEAVVGVLSVTRDITAHVATKAKLAETSSALRLAERSYQDLYDHAPDSYVSIDPKTRATVRCNQTLLRALGHRDEDTLVGKSMLVLCQPESHEAFEDALNEVVETGGVANVRLDLRHREGSSVPVLLTASAARGIDGRISHARCAFRNVAEVVALEARKAAMLEAALDAVITIDHTGTIVEFNPAAEAMFGHAIDDVVGRPLAEIIIPERMRKAHREGIERANVHSTLRRRVELDALHADGREFPVEVSIVRLPDIEPPTFTGFVRDLTDLKAARQELEHTIHVLERSNADLERFAHIASHDLQEPLRMVTTFMELLRDAYAGKLDDTADTFIGHAVDGARRMKRLIDDLLEYSRVDTRTAPHTACDLAEVLGRVKLDLGAALEAARGTMEWGSLPTIWADEGQIEQLLRNLVSNAIKYRHPDRPPVVTIDAETAEDAWVIVVEDNGVGFDPELSGRIFEMFQRLHPRTEHEGSGIGLAVAKRIVERHGGKLWAKSAPGVGSSFYFEIPRGKRST